MITGKHGTRDNKIMYQEVSNKTENRKYTALLKGTT